MAYCRRLVRTGLSMLLCIDSGNSKTKWAVFNSAGEIVDFGSGLNSELADLAFPSASAYQRIIVSNVAGAAHQASIIKRLASKLPMHTVQSPAVMAGLRNHYQVAQALGSDRFSAMMAAYCMQKASCVVVSAGTAVTIDALSVHGTQADFLGGWILPGLHLMQQSLTQAAAQLPETSFSSKPAEQTKFASNTEDAMQFGALNAVVGAIKEMSAALTANDNKPSHVIISGGDAALIKTGLAVTTPCSIVDNLVLHGLYFMDRNLQSESQ